MSKVVTKKAKPNGFAVFMQDIRDRYREEGQRVPSMAEMVNIANPLWSELSPQDRSYFNQRAKVASKSGLSMAKVVTDTRLDCLGEALADRVDEKGQIEERRKSERQFTRARWPVGKAAAKCRFYFIDFQYICHVEKGNYFPCEISAIEYSIECGIIRSWHKFVDPGKIPTGYRWEAQNRSEQTHKIPIEKFELAEDNYELILDELQVFINPRRESEFPPIFTRKDDAEIAESCCRWLAERTETAHELFKVYVLEYLLIDLSSHISDIAPSSHESKDMLSSSAFDYEPGANCAWHETREIRHCSLGVVNRLAYIFSDHLCPKYNITMGPKHLPIVRESHQQTVLSPGPQETDFVFPSRDVRYFPSPRQTPFSSARYDTEDNESLASYATESANSVYPVYSQQGVTTPASGSSSPLVKRGRGRGRAKMHSVDQPQVGSSTYGTIGDTVQDIDSESLLSTDTALNSLQISSAPDNNPWSAAPPVSEQGYPVSPQRPSLTPDSFYNPYPLASVSIPQPSSVPSPAPAYYNPAPSPHLHNPYTYNMQPISNAVPQYNPPLIPQSYPPQPVPAIPPPNATHTSAFTHPSLLQQPGTTYSTQPSLYQYPQYQQAPVTQHSYPYNPPYQQTNPQSTYAPQQPTAILPQPQVPSLNPSQAYTPQVMSVQQGTPTLPAAQGQIPSQMLAPQYQHYGQYPQNVHFPQTQPLFPVSQTEGSQILAANQVQQGAYYPHPPHQVSPNPEQAYPRVQVPVQPQ